MEKMEYHRYSAVPIIDEEGKYVASISEGDILWHLKHTEGIMFKDTEKLKLTDIKRYREFRPISINSDIENIIDLAAVQSFVPVVDDNGIFIGIIKRSDIINYGYRNVFNKKVIEVYESVI